MADQAPPTHSEPAVTATAGSAVPALPEKIRVHALAKLLGVTSKQVLAEAAALGTELRSAQSSLQRDISERIRAIFAPAETTGEPEPPEQAQDTVDAAETEPGTDVLAVDVIEVTPETGILQAPEADAPEADALEPDVWATGAGLDFFAPAPSPVVSDEAETPVAEPVSPDVQVPLFLQPEPVAVETAPRRRRSRRDSGKPETTTAPEQSADEHSQADSVRSEASSSEDSPDPTIAESGSVGTELDESEGDHPRRRRRGRRGRGRGRGEQQNEQGTEAEEASDDSEAGSSEEDKGADGKDLPEDSTPSAAESTEGSGDESVDADARETGETESAEGEAGDGSSRRRRRRRRRKSGSEASGEGDITSEDDPPNTVIHEREPRNKSRSKDEVQGISGSTRLEAKRQRRRDGRDAGRRRPPILTESEFLARREAVDRVMVVRDRIITGQPHATTQVGVLEDGVLVEHFVTTSASASMVGNIYLGRVQNVLPSMEAAFIDIGRGRNGVLYAGEVNWEAAGLGGNSRKIEQALKPGDQVLVQVSKDPVGHKGARLTTQISLAGRFLVYVPGGTSTGISRKLPDTERKRLKDILRDIVPADAGVIIRTASEGVSEEELAKDVERLQSQWAEIEKQASEAESGKAGVPQALYEEPDLLVKVIRDLFNEDFSKLVIEGDKAWTTVESYIKSVAPDLLPRLEQHTLADGGRDVFEAHRIDEQLAKALDRKVWLPSGGTLVIDRTEAMTVVDVNTGKFTGSGGNLEETVTRNNLEAAEEIVRQMRLRDIGGMIVVDFIDMVLESNRDLVLRRLTEALGRDRTRHQVSEVTSLGLVQMTRKKLGTGLVEAFSTTCEHCHGRGIIVHADPIEVKSSEDTGSRGSSRGEFGGPRKRRGREKSTSADSSQGSSHEDAAVADATIKRAHPVALAMANHHHDHEVAHNQDETQSADAPAEETSSAAPVESSAEVPDEAVSAEVPAGGVVEDEPVVEEPQVRTEGEPSGETESVVPVRRRSRRVSRAAAAPASAAPTAGTVFVIPAPEQGPENGATSSAPVSEADSLPSSQPEPAESQQPEPTESQQPEPAAPRQRRRRAAGRPAGPPVHVEN